MRRARGPWPGVPHLQVGARATLRRAGGSFTGGLPRRRGDAAYSGAVSGYRFGAPPIARFAPQAVKPGEAPADKGGVPPTTRILHRPGRLALVSLAALVAVGGGGVGLAAQTPSQAAGSTTQS